MDDFVKIEKVEGDGEDSLFNVKVKGKTVMQSASMSMVISYLSKLNEDEDSK